MQPEVAPRRRAAGLRPGLSRLDSATDASDGTANLIGLEQRSVHHETTDAGASSCGTCGVRSME